MRISPPETPPSLFFFKNPNILLLDKFFSTLGSAIQFYQLFDFGGIMDFFRFLGFRCILEGNDKFQKRKWAYVLLNVSKKWVLSPF